MNLLNINLIRKKSQQFYKIIPEFYQSAPCRIVKRALILITNRRRGSLPLTRLANLPRFVLRLLFQFLQLFSPSLFFAFVSRRNSVLLNNSYIFLAKRVTDTAPLVIYSRMFVVIKSTPQETSFSAYSRSFTIQQLIFMPRRLSSAIFSSFKDI